MDTHSPHSLLLRRDQSSGPRNAGIIAGVIFVVLIVLGLCTYTWLHRRPPSVRTADSSNQNKNKWHNFWVRRQSTRLLDEETRPASAARSRTRGSHNSNTNNAAAAVAATGGTQGMSEMVETGAADHFDRRTSVRSILSLPPYVSSPRPDEHVVAREGEREGIDTVVEFPESTEEEEVRRMEEMDSLFIIRQTRQQELAAQEERRRQRREAITQQDWQRLAELRRADEIRRAAIRARAAESTTSLATIASTVGNNSITSLPMPTAGLTSREMLIEHRANMANRARRISSVSYASLGLARHDGSRIRAGSDGSDNAPLLDGMSSSLTLARTVSSRNGSNINLSSDSLALYSPNTAPPTVPPAAAQAPRHSRFHLPHMNSMLFSRRRLHQMTSTESFPSIAEDQHLHVDPIRRVLNAGPSASNLSLARPVPAGTGHCHQNSASSIASSSMVSLAEVQSETEAETGVPSHEPPQYHDSVSTAGSLAEGQEPPPEYTSPGPDRGQFAATISTGASSASSRTELAAVRSNETEAESFRTADSTPRRRRSGPLLQLDMDRIPQAGTPPAQDTIAQAKEKQNESINHHDSISTFNDNDDAAKDNKDDEKCVDTQNDLVQQQHIRMEASGEEVRADEIEAEVGRSDSVPSIEIITSSPIAPRDV